MLVSIKRGGGINYRTQIPEVLKHPTRIHVPAAAFVVHFPPTLVNAVAASMVFWKPAALIPARPQLMLVGAVIRFTRLFSDAAGRARTYRSCQPKGILWRIVKPGPTASEDKATKDAMVAAENCMITMVKYQTPRSRIKRSWRLKLMNAGCEMLSRWCVLVWRSIFRIDECWLWNTIQKVLAGKVVWEIVSYSREGPSHIYYLWAGFSLITS